MQAADDSPCLDKEVRVTFEISRVPVSSWIWSYYFRCFPATSRCRLSFIPKPSRSKTHPSLREQLQGLDGVQGVDRSSRFTPTGFATNQKCQVYSFVYSPLKKGTQLYTFSFYYYLFLKYSDLSFSDKEIHKALIRKQKQNKAWLIFLHEIIIIKKILLQDLFTMLHR